MRLLGMLLFCTALWPVWSARAAGVPTVNEITVTAPRPPTPSEIAGSSIPEFIAHHAKASIMLKQLARWEVGICPKTEGLDAPFNIFITARMRAVATAVGAPVDASPKCVANVHIIFTLKPQDLMDEVAKRAPQLLGFHYPHQVKNLAHVTRPIQGFYITATEFSSGATVIDESLPLSGPPVDSSFSFSRLKTATSSTIEHALVVADLKKVTGYTAGELADYISELVLSVVVAPDDCDPLPSIMNLMATMCQDREKPTGITSGDLAYLRGLYKTNMHHQLDLQRSDIQDSMMREFHR